MNDIFFIRLTNSELTCIVDLKNSWLNSHRWCVNLDGYAVSYINKKMIYMHKLILKAKLVDHKNKNKLDNRESNLQVSSRSFNGINREKVLTKNSTSRYKGVSFMSSRNAWRARIMKDKIEYHIGLFNTEEAAAKNYNKVALELFGTRAVLNVVKLEDE